MDEQKNTRKEKRFLEDLFSFIKENTKKEDKFVLAISGGADSMVLLDLFLTLSQKNPISFCVANLDHKIRKESANEQQWLSSFCAEKGIRFYGQRADIKALKSSMGATASLEELARNERYRLFKKIKQEFQAKWVVTAHHKDDLLETFFLRLLRGTGLNGINTLNKVDRSFLRPLLGYFKEELLNYAKERNLFYFEDYSNKDTQFLRNRIRHKMIPFLLKEFGESVKEILVRDIDNLKNADRVVTEIVNKDIQKARFTNDSVTISQHFLKDKSQSYLYEFLIRLYQKWNRTPSGLTGVKLDNICRRVMETGDFEITISDDIRFLRSNKIIGFDRRVQKKEKREKKIIMLGEQLQKKLEANNVITLGLNLFDSGKSVKLMLQTGSFKKNFKPTEASHTAFIDYDLIQFPLCIRLWNEGDRIKPLGMSCYKRVSRLMTDEGIKKYNKRRQLILENGKHDIIWCMGIRISEDYKITPSTVRCLKIIYIDSNEQDIEGRERCIPQRFAKDEEK